MPPSFQAFHGAHNSNYGYGLSFSGNPQGARYDAVYSSQDFSRSQAGPPAGLDGAVLDVEIALDSEELMDWSAVLEKRQPAVVSLLAAAGIWQEYKRSRNDLDYPAIARGAGTGCNLYNFLSHRAGWQACADERTERCGLLAPYCPHGPTVGVSDALVRMSSSEQEQFIALTGQMIQKYHTGQVDATRLLMAAGVPGLRYVRPPDAHCEREQARQTVFDSSVVTVVRRNEQPVTKPEAANLLARMVETVEICRQWHVANIARTRETEARERIAVAAALAAPSSPDKYLPAREPEPTHPSTLSL